MTCLAVEPQVSLHSHSDRWDAIRASVFWGFILLVIASPAALSAMILMRL
jgi:hypothetical protein